MAHKKTKIKTKTIKLKFVVSETAAPCRLLYSCLSFLLPHLLGLHYFLYHSIEYQAPVLRYFQYPPPLCWVLR